MSLIDRDKLLQRVYDHPYERDRMTDAEWYRKCIYEAPAVCCDAGSITVETQNDLNVIIAQTLCAKCEELHKKGGTVPECWGQYSTPCEYHIKAHDLLEKYDANSCKRGAKQ